MSDSDQKCSCGDPACAGSSGGGAEQTPHNHSHDGHGDGCACNQFLNPDPMTDEERAAIENDPAAGSLARALKGSFFFLKLGMLVLLLFFGLDRFRSVNDGEVMVIKRFGAYLSDENGIKIFEPGRYHFVWPYPIEEPKVLRLSEEKQLDLGGRFWPRISGDAAINPDTIVGAAEELDADLDGYNITGDLNILHTRWKVKYRINSYRDYLLTSANPLEEFKGICEDAIVRSFAGTSVDQAYYGDRQTLFDRIGERINARLSQGRLGVELVSLINVSLLPPGKTQEAFDRLTSSLSERKKLIDKARTEANTALKEGETEAQRTRNAALEYKVATVARAQADASRIRDLLARFPGDPQGLELFLHQYRYDRLREALAKSRVYVLREGNNIFWTTPGTAEFTTETAPAGAQPAGNQ